MNKEKISVIVPIYKVEDYLRRCLDSIINQTFSNLEIILIDDDSPDNCGRICNEYAAKDDRIIVLHQSNEGLAETRNIGIKKATSQYIVFIDSDDYIENTMIEILYNNLKKYDADISCCGHLEIYPNCYEERNSEKIFCSLYSSEEALKCFMYTHELDVVSWNKLYKKELFDGIYFPKGKLYEDHYTIYRLLDKADLIVYDSQPLYFYCKRDNSIGGRGFNNRMFELRDALEQECGYIKDKYPQISKDIDVAMIVWLIVIYDKMILSDYSDRVFKRDLIGLLRKNIFNVMCSKYLYFRNKVQLLILLLNRPCYRLLYKWYVKKYRGV